MSHKKKKKGRKGRKFGRSPAQREATRQMILANGGRGNRQTRRARKSSLRNLAKADRAEGHEAAARKVAHQAAMIHVPPRRGGRGRKRNPGPIAIVGRRGELRPARGQKRPGYAVAGVSRTTSYTNRRTGRSYKITDGYRANPMNDKMAFLIGAVTLAGGLLIFCGLHAYVVTRGPSGKHAAMGRDAQLRIQAAPSGMTYVVLGGATVALGAGAAALRKRSPKIAAALTGFTLAGGAYTVLLFGRFVILPRLFKVKRGDEISWANRAYAAEQLTVQEAMQKEIDRQDKDPLYEGWAEVDGADGKLLPAIYAYEGERGAPFPALAVGSILTNTGSGLEAFLFPTARQRKRVTAPPGGAKRPAFSMLAKPDMRVSNHAAGCGGAGACTCPGKGIPTVTAADLRKEADELRSAGYAGAAAKMIAQAEALERGAKRPTPAPVQAGNQAGELEVQGDEPVYVGGRPYVPADVPTQRAIDAAKAQALAELGKRAPPPAARTATVPASPAPRALTAARPRTVPSAWDHPINAPARAAAHH